MGCSSSLRSFRLHCNQTNKSFFGKHPQIRNMPTPVNLPRSRMYHNHTPSSYHLRDGVLKPNDHRRGENGPHYYIGNCVNSKISIVDAISSLTLWGYDNTTHPSVKGRYCQNYKSKTVPNKQSAKTRQK